MPKKTKKKPAIPTTTSNVAKDKRTGAIWCYQSQKYEIFPTQNMKTGFNRIFGGDRWWRNHLIKYNNMEYFHNPDAGFIGYNNGFDYELTRNYQGC